MAKKEIHFDVRVSHRYINDGIVTKKEYEDYLKKLPDVSEKATTIILEDEEEITEESQDAESIEEQD